MKIIIPGDPIPKARHRSTRKGITYDPQHKIKKSTAKFLSNEIKKFYQNNENRKEGYLLSSGEAFEVDWYFYMSIPKSFNQNKKNACKWGFIEHTSKPDRSNLEKFYEDCANGILWKDDSQITKGKIIKKYCYDDKPRTEIHMKVIKQPNEDLKQIVSLFSPEEISGIVFDVSSLSDFQSEEKLPMIASFLSKLADQHAAKLSKITKKYPGYWKKSNSNNSMKLQ